jgi:hypothetical protein
MSSSAFASGFLQPLLMPVHALALLALGLLLGQQGRARGPLMAFAAALTAGLAAIALAVGPTPAGNVVLLAAALVGILVSLAMPLPMLSCAGFAAATGAALGLDSPPQAISLTAATATLIGSGLGAGCAITIVTLTVRSLQRGWQRIGVRIVGSWIAASAILVLALRYVRGLLF